MQPCRTNLSALTRIAESRRKILRRFALMNLCAGGFTQARTQVISVIVPVVKGHVQSPGGIPLANAEITADGIKGTIRTDALGGFSLSNVTQGALTLTVRRIGYLPAVQEFEIPVQNDSLIVTLVPMRAALDTIKVLAEMNVIAGIVVDEYFKPVPGATVDLIGNRKGTDTTGSDGWFTFT